MAAAHDNSASVAGVARPGTPQSTTITVNSLGALGLAYLWIAVQWTDDGSGVNGATAVVDVGGAAPTFYGSTFNGRHVDVYYFQVTSTGSKTVTVTNTGDGGANLVLGIESVSGVDFTTPLSTAQTATGSGTTASKAITGTSASNLVVDAMAINASKVVTKGASQTQRWNVRNSTAPAVTGAGSTQPSAAGSITMSWTWSLSSAWGIVVGEFKEGTAPPPTAAPQRMLTGVGL